MKLTFLECGDEHLPGVQDFFSRVYKADYILATDEALLRWQFGGIDGPNGRFHIKLALVDDRVAACLGYIPADISVCGRTLRGAWTANWIVDPDTRQMALGPRLMTELVQQHQVTLVAGASLQAQQILPRLGFTTFGELARHVCVVEPAGAAALSCSSTSAWRSANIPAVYGQKRAAIELVAEFDGAVERVWNGVWGKDGAGTRRSAAFLNWRYGSHPRFDYRMFLAGTREQPTGFAVYRVEAVEGAPVRVGRVVEFVGEPAAEDALLTALFLDARAQHVAVLDYFCTSARPAAALARQGWLPEHALPAPIPVLLQPVAPGRRGIPFLGHVRKAGVSDDIQCWYVTKGDGDQDRPN